MRMAWSATPKMRCLTGAVDPLDGVQDIDVGVIVHIFGFIAAVPVVECENHQNTGRFFLYGDPVFHHGIGQLRRSQINPVLYLDLGNIRVGVEAEIDSQGQLPGARAGRRHVEQVVNAIDLGFQGRSNRIGNCSGIGAGIKRGDGYLNGCDGWILGNRKAFHRDQAGDDNDKRDDRGKNRPLDEKPGEHRPGLCYSPFLVFLTVIFRSRFRALGIQGRLCFV